MREHSGITWGRACIYVSYFDFPFIYCSIGGITLGQAGPLATLIMNLMDGKTYYTPLNYHVFGIFESE
jgi:hypothetical protein